jgi:origin recognition complex subunit 5
MIAILGALLENNDVDTRLNTSDFDFAGEHTDLEITRVGVSASVRNTHAFHAV